MKRRHAILSLCLPGLLGILAGCATPPHRADNAMWQGRLALRVFAEPAAVTPASTSFSAAFDLSGDADQGELRFYSPLGSTVAAIRWGSAGASVQAHGETRQYDNLNQLIIDTLGADVPVAALFQWLAGHAQPVPGWQLDLSARAQGKITAHRLSAPAAELRVILDD